MKLSKCISYINTALNYPALSYEDIHVFFDMAISELNTTLHTRIPTVSSMIEDFQKSLLDPEPNKIILTDSPEDTDYVITISNSAPETVVPCYYSPETKKFYIFDNYFHVYSEGFDTVKAIYVEAPKVRSFVGTVYGNDAAWWVEVPNDPTFECELSDYLPDDWVLLWLIPYVCYKYTVRDGGTAGTFAEELTQGFQQLQETYDIPSKVNLMNNAGKVAYADLVKDYLPNINIIVNTRAIYEDMKHPRNVNAIFGSMYDRGGF